MYASNYMIDISMLRVVLLRIEINNILKVTK